MSCEKIQDRFLYQLPATRSGNRSDPDCEASWTLKNKTVIAITHPYNFTAPAVRVEDDRLLTDRCERELFYRMDCISGFSEEFKFHCSDPCNSPSADNGYLWFILIPVFLIVLCLAIWMYLRRRRSRQNSERMEPCRNVGKSSRDSSLDDLMLEP